MAVYMILVDGDCDQIVETRAIAEREKRDLINMGCGPVRIREFPCWEAAEQYEDKLNG